MAEEDAPPWQCYACTFANSYLLPRCEMCETPRRRPKVARQEELSTPFEATASKDLDIAPAANGACRFSSSSSSSSAPAPGTASSDCQSSGSSSNINLPGIAPTSAAGLSAAERAQFSRDGYLILRSIVPAAECSRLLWERVAPALAHKGLDPFDEATWADGSDGTVVKGRHGSDHPIPLSCPDARWPALFESPTLVSVLDQLHGGSRRWSWAYAAAEGLGWVHIRFPVADGTEWQPPEDGWHIDGDSPSLDTSSSVVLLPMLTTIRPGGGGTALLRGSHRRVAALLHNGGRVRPSTLVRSEIEHRGAADAVVEATGRAGDVLMMHPLLVHAPSSAHRTTLHQGAWVRHGLRITFNLATQWARPPLRARDGEGRSLLEESIVSAVAEAAQLDQAPRRVVRYGEPIELRFVACGMMMGVLQPSGALSARAPATPPRGAHVFAFGAGCGSHEACAGEAVRFGDAVTLRSVQCAGDPLVVSLGGGCGEGEGEGGGGGDAAGVGDSSSAAVRIDPAGGPAAMLRVEGQCDLRGVCLRAGDKLLLRAVGCTSTRGRAGGGSSRAAKPAAAPRLYAEPSADDAERLVQARAGRRGDANLLEVLAVGPLRASGWLLK